MPEGLRTPSLDGVRGSWGRERGGSGGVPSAVHYDASCGGVDMDPVVLRPDVYVLEALEVGGFVFLVVFVAPEVHGHGGEGLSAC